VTVSAKRLLAIVLTIAAEAAAIVTVVTGPEESLAFDLRLPLLVLVLGGLLTVRRPLRLVPTGWITEPPRPVPMATPWLVLSATAVIALLTAKAYESDPQLIAGVLGGGATFCLLACCAVLIQWLRLPADGPELVGEG
jgi:hypothetical protein